MTPTPISTGLVLAPPDQATGLALILVAVDCLLLVLVYLILRSRVSRLEREVGRLSRRQKPP